jgi:hypothetical protein
MSDPSFADKMLTDTQAASKRKHAAADSIQDSNTNLSESTMSKRQKFDAHNSHEIVVGRSMMSKRKLNDAVKEGTFKRNPAQWDTYKSKLHNLDPHFEVDDRDPTCARIVRHSICAKDIIMSAPYDISRFKEHTKACTKSSSAASNTHTLHAMFNKQSQRQQVQTPQQTKMESKQKVTSQSQESVLWPCPGLTQSYDPRIQQYLERTEAGSAGGVSERTLAEEMFNTRFGKLESFQKHAVTLRQIQTHRWCLDHPRYRVFAIGLNKCLENVVVRKDSQGSLPLDKLEPCANCIALLSLPAFQTVISKPIPEDKNRVSVPHKYQNAAIGKMYIKSQGLSDLLSEVSI